MPQVHQKVGPLEVGEVPEVLGGPDGPVNLEVLGDPVGPGDLTEPGGPGSIGKIREASC